MKRLITIQVVVEEDTRIKQRHSFAILDKFVAVTRDVIDANTDVLYAEARIIHATDEPYQ